jgi:hypothetical protein
MRSGHYPDIATNPLGGIPVQKSERFQRFFLPSRLIAGLSQGIRTKTGHETYIAEGCCYAPQPRQ